MSENDICSTLAPKYMPNKRRRKLHTELSNRLCSAEMQSLAALELEEFLLKMTSLGSTQDTLKLLGRGPAGCTFRRPAGGLLLHSCLNTRDFDKVDYPADFTD